MVVSYSAPLQSVASAYPVFTIEGYAQCGVSGDVKITKPTAVCGIDLQAKAEPLYMSIPDDYIFQLITDGACYVKSDVAHCFITGQREAHEIDGDIGAFDDDPVAR